MYLSEAREIEIKEAYRDYAPPFNASAVVRGLLRTVPDKYLNGLDCVVLTNISALSRRDRVGKVWSRKRKFSKAGVLGFYHHGSRNSSPYIELRVDAIIESTERGAMWIPFLRTVAFGHVLFHEIGHHIHSTIRPQHDEKEDVADTWAGKLNANFIRKKYWYALPVLIPAIKVYRIMRRLQWI